MATQGRDRFHPSPLGTLSLLQLPTEDRLSRRSWGRGATDGMSYTQDQRELYQEAHRFTSIVTPREGSLTGSENRRPTTPSTVAQRRQAPTYGAVRGDLSPLRVVFQQFELPFGWFPS